LSESVANQGGLKKDVLDRINPRSGDTGALFFEIEILPRLRAIRDRLRRDTSTHRNITSVQHEETQRLEHYSAS
ncbi:MAG TPA: hypothetical protein VFX22_09255, partial [Candidatus Kapabacteria bacterium]|nr:hypothetical protein [Candidatus Kapabacteria bacterium]